jgi:Mn-dependent DtxR family transcriptional regulator
MDSDGYLTLTKDGLAAANKIFERHTVLSQLLIRLGVSEKTAAEDACKIEHVISDETFEAVKQYLNR